MPGTERTYCYRCGRKITLPATRCEHCGASIEMTRSGRIAGIGFVLNELQRAPMQHTLTTQQRARLVVHYEDEIAAYSRPAGRTSVPAPTVTPPHITAIEPERPAPAPAYAANGAPILDRRTPRMAPTITLPAPPAPPAPPKPPRPSVDWSWLVEQQANLFLFAGAFLTVIAALIYVGYSGQAVDGVLKMTLLSVYTLGFLGAGFVCLRIPRVEVAGKVFFAIGAILVPMNFVAARTLLTDRDLSPEFLWLSGSIITAAFYTSVAWLGLGRAYAFAAGASIVSATVAAATISGMPAEWMPVCFIAVAGVMSLVHIRGNETARTRLGETWSLQAYAVAVLSMLGAVGTAIIDMDSSTELDAQRWFLPVTFIAFAFFALVPALAQGRLSAAIAAMIGVAGGIATTVYAAELNPQLYAFAFVAIAIVFAASAASDQIIGRLPGKTRETMRSAALLAAGLAAAGAIVAVVSDADAGSTYEVQSRWFLPATFAALAAYALAPMLGERRIEGAVLAAAGVVGAIVTLVYAFELPAETYAITFAAAAIVAAVATFAATRDGIATRLPRHSEYVTHTTGMLAVATAVGVAVSAALAGADASFAVTLRWFLPATFALVAVHGVITLAAIRRLEGVASVAAGVAGAIIAVVYAAEWPVEQYAVATAASAMALGVAAFVANRYERIARLPDGGMQTLHICATIAASAAIAVGTIAALTDADRELTFAVASRWFLPATFAMVAAYALLPVVTLKKQESAVLAIAGVAGAIVTLVYAIDLPIEHYATAFAGVALLAAVAAAATRERFASRLPQASVEMLRATSIGTGITAAAVTFGIAMAATNADANFDIATRWFAPIVFGMVLLSYVIDAFWQRDRVGTPGVFASTAGTIGSVLYALDVSGEYYVIAAAVPAVAFATIALRGHHAILDRLAAEWRGDAIVCGRIAIAAAIVYALGIAALAEDPSNAWLPQTRWYLAGTFAAAVVFFALDAARRPRPEVTAAMLGTLTGLSLAVPYALEADAAYYGVALTATGVALAFLSRTRCPAWIDANVRDVAASVLVTMGWLGFEAPYAAHPQIGAAVHFAAAGFYALTAVFDRSTRTLGDILDVPLARGIRLASGWIYASACAAMLGYLFVLDALATGEPDAGGSLAYPLLAAALGFATLGAATRFWRPEFRMHLYVVAMIVALTSIGTAPDALALSIILSVIAVVSLALAIYEDEAAIAIPAGVLGFAIVPAWIEHFDAPLSTIPLQYSAIGVALGALTLAVRERGRWPMLLQAAGAAYVLAAPIVGFVLADAEATTLTPFHETPLYQASVISLAIAGLVACAAAYVSGRRWAWVPASGVLLLALLLQIGRLNPENIQAYTLVTGVYVLALGLVGLWKLRLIPEFAEFALAVEAAGAAIIMMPSFLQSLEGGWRYQWILLAEALVLFTLAVVLRRRGILGAAILALALVAARALFDAVNALPNWIVVMAAGLSLLGVGFAILVGRDRWSEWQRALLGWWDESASDGHVTL